MEAGGDRWSKPHVGTIAMHAIKEIEVQVQADKGCVILDLETHSIQAKFFMIIFIDARTEPDVAGPDGSDIYYYDKHPELWIRFDIEIYFTNKNAWRGNR